MEVSLHIVGVYGSEVLVASAIETMTLKATVIVIGEHLSEPHWEALQDCKVILDGAMSLKGVVVDGVVVDGGDIVSKEGGEVS